MSTFVALAKGTGARLPPLSRGCSVCFARSRPAIVHTRNLAALEATCRRGSPACRCASTASTAATSAISTARNRRYQWVRRAVSAVCHQYVALSRDLEHYLRDGVGVPAARVEQIYNGVDTRAFRAAPDERDGRSTAARSPTRISGSSARSGACSRSRIRLTLAQRLRARASQLRRSRGDAHAAGHGRRRAAARQRSSACWTRPGCAIWRGSRASAPTFRTSCAGSIASCCRRWPKASRTRFSRRWPRVCRSWPPRVGGNPELVDDGVDRRAGAGRRTASAGAGDACAISTTRRWRAGTAGQAGARSSGTSASIGWSRHYRSLYDRLLAGAHVHRRRPRGRPTRLQADE